VTARRLSVLSQSDVDSPGAAASDKSSSQRNSESWRLQLRNHSAGDHLQNGAVLSRRWSSPVYATIFRYSNLYLL